MNCSSGPTAPSPSRRTHGCSSPVFSTTKANRLPWLGKARVIAATTGFVARTAVAAITRAFPSQGNLFAFVVEKTGELQPWMRREGDELRPDEQFIRKRIRG